MILPVKIWFTVGGSYNNYNNYAHAEFFFHFHTCHSINAPLYIYSVATQAKTIVCSYQERKTADNGLFNDAIIFINYHSITSLTTQHRFVIVVIDPHLLTFTVAIVNTPLITGEQTEKHSL